jgi:hypothetical protein
MSEPAQSEIWQVEVGGQVYEAGADVLAEWISEGALQPHDMVRRGNLRWIEAGKVPHLALCFRNKTRNTASRVEVSTTAYQPQTTAGCANHTDREGRFICSGCGQALCRDCVKTFGSSVMICAACGVMCKPIVEFQKQSQTENFRAASIAQGFGFSDFGEAVCYPFKFKASLVIGAAMFMFFSLGRSASGFGGIHMAAAGLFSLMLANMLAYGVLSHTVIRFSQGQIGGNFMPEFEDFSIWDDVLHPFFLSIGVYISSLGPFILVFVVGLYFVLSTVTGQMETVRTNLETTPGTLYYNVRDTVEQSDQVKDVLKESEKINKQRLEAQQNAENGTAPPAVDQEQEIQRIDKMIAENQRRELESVMGKSPETRERESAAMIAGFLKLAAPIVVIGFIALAWGLFYFPAACIVAGYSQSFVEAINPLVGLDTIRRMGLNYFKVLGMELLLLFAFAAVASVISLILSPFDLPGFGNLPASAIQSVIWFYLVIVFACILGLAMFKSSDRLRLPT